MSRLIGWVSSIFSSAEPATNEMTAQTVGRELDAFHTFLTGGKNPVVRMWVEETSNLGNQSSTINLVYRLARPRTDSKLTYGYGGTIEVYYEAKETLGKIWQLLPELSGKTKGSLNNAQVKLILWSKAPDGDPVDLGITGAADQTPEGGFPKKLNVKVFLHLQPYLWKPQLEGISFLDDLRSSINLNEQESLGREAFGRRLYFIDPSLYQNPSFDVEEETKAEIIKYLTSKPVLDNYGLQGIYSFKNYFSYINGDPLFAIALCCGAGLRWQGLPGSPSRGARPLLIVNFDNFDDVGATMAAAALPKVKKILEGGLTPQEEAWDASGQISQTARQNITRRQNYFKAMKVADKDKPRFVGLYKPALELDDVKRAVEAISG
jgi:hypothetical protein